MFCFEICILDGRGGEKRGSANFKANNAIPYLRILPRQNLVQTKVALLLSPTVPPTHSLTVTLACKPARTRQCRRAHLLHWNDFPTGPTWRGTAHTAASFAGQSNCSSRRSVRNKPKATEAEGKAAAAATTGPVSAASRPTKNGTSNCCGTPIAGLLSSTGGCTGRVKTDKGGLALHGYPLHLRLCFVHSDFDIPPLMPSYYAHSATFPPAQAVSCRLRK